MIGVQDAVTAARRFVSEIYGTHILEEVTLEEIEPSADDRFWLITLGFPRSFNALVALAAPDALREFKVFQVDAASAQVHSMKIRQVA
jgi:hypothetical protein